MKMKKRFLSLVLSATMVLGSFSMAFAAESTANVTAADRLKNLEIVTGDEGGLRLGDTITRAEVAAVMVRVVGKENIAKISKGSVEFNDVPATHWASGYIKVAKTLGLINGYGDGNFGPEDEVTFEQTLTMVVRALGYAPKADSLGGYPMGYMIVADELGLTVDAEGTVGTKALRGSVFQVLDNSLEQPMMVQVGYGDSAEYKVSGEDGIDKVELMNKIDAEKVADVVILGATDETVTVFENGKEEEYELATEVATSLYGKTATLYLNGDSEVVVVSEGTNELEEIVVAEIKDGKIVDDTDDANKYVVAKDAQMYYNGTRMEYAAAKLVEGAEVTLISNTTVEDEEDAAYEMMVVKVYEGPYTVSKDYASKYDYVRAIKLGKSATSKIELVLDDDDEVDSDANVVVGADKLTDLEEGTIIYIAKDADDATKLEILVVEDTVTGEFDEIEDGEYVIDGKSYEVHEDVDFEDLLGNEEVEVTLGRNGEIIAMEAVEEEETTTTVYGFVVARSITDADDFEDDDAEDTLKVKVFTEADKKVVYTVKSEATILGTEDVNTRAEFEGITFSNTQLVELTLNEDNLVTKLEAVAEKEVTDAVVKSSYFTKGTAKYRVDEDTKIFVNYTDADGDKVYDVVAFDDIDDTNALDINVYEKGDFSTYGVVVIEEKVEAATTDGTIAIVSDITKKGKNDDGDLLAKFYVVLEDGTETSYESEIVYEDVYNQVGSIVEFTIDDDDVVTKSSENEEVQNKTVLTISDEMIEVKGDVSYSINEDVVVYTYDGEEADLADIEAEELDEDDNDAVVVEGTKVSFYVNDDEEVTMIIIEEVK